MVEVPAYDVVRRQLATDVVSRPWEGTWREPLPRSRSVTDELWALQLWREGIRTLASYWLVSTPSPHGQEVWSATPSVGAWLGILCRTLRTGW